MSVLYDHYWPSYLPEIFDISACLAYSPASSCDILQIMLSLLSHDSSDIMLMLIDLPCND